mmetsp:Transcript_6680/g.25985  ORF Transcript_6680/g.25985 Transcript_6680/m.25985 type:complete len:411 (+) Transcript_6680:3-1235(+)
MKSCVYPSLAGSSVVQMTRCWRPWGVSVLLRHEAVINLDTEKKYAQREAYERCRLEDRSEIVAEHLDARRGEDTTPVGQDHHIIGHQIHVISPKLTPLLLRTLGAVATICKWIVLLRKHPACAVHGVAVVRHLEPRVSVFTPVLTVRILDEEIRLPALLVLAPADNDSGVVDGVDLIARSRWAVLHGNKSATVQLQGLDVHADRDGLLIERAEQCIDSLRTPQRRNLAEAVDGHALGLFVGLRLHAPVTRSWEVLHAKDTVLLHLDPCIRRGHVAGVAPAVEFVARKEVIRAWAWAVASANELAVGNHLHRAVCPASRARTLRVQRANIHLLPPVQGLREIDVLWQRLLHGSQPGSRVGSGHSHCSGLRFEVRTDGLAEILIDVSIVDLHLHAVGIRLCIRLTGRAEHIS